MLVFAYLLGIPSWGERCHRRPLVAVRSSQRWVVTLTTKTPTTSTTFITGNEAFNMQTSYHSNKPAVNHNVTITSSHSDHHSDLSSTHNSHASRNNATSNGFVSDLDMESRLGSKPGGVITHVNACIPDEELVWECVEVLMDRRRTSVSLALRDYGIGDGDEDSESEEGLLWNEIEQKSQPSELSSLR